MVIANNEVASAGPIAIGRAWDIWMIPRVDTISEVSREQDPWGQTVGSPISDARALAEGEASVTIIPMLVQHRPAIL